MKTLLDFVSQHMSDDTARLILDRDKWTGIDMDLAVACIESRRKIRGKVQEWYDNPDLIFPVRLSAEQCSGSATANYKSALAQRIAGEKEWKIADLTGGLGVDSWFFSKKASSVLYNEMQEKLCEAAGYNFKVLGATNIQTSRTEATRSTIGSLLEPFRPDIVYIDPARRGEGGRKVFLIEDCTPDVLTLKEDIFRYSRHILIKLSPMADISMACERLGSTCREVHVAGHGGECKELLIWMDREWNDGYTVTAAELPADYPVNEAATFTFNPAEEKTCAPIPAGLAGLIGNKPENLYLFEPGKAMMKAGSFNLISRCFNAGKLGASTHYYLTDRVDSNMARLGKLFIIKHIHSLDKRSVKSVGKEFPKADVTARNLPMTSETLQKKLGCSSGNGIHVFGLRSDSEGPLLIVTERITV